MNILQSQPSSGSLVKSKELLDRISHKISAIESNRQNIKVIKSIQNSSKKMQQTIDHRIEQNFNSILHAPTLMPLSTLKAHTEKEINLSSCFNAVDGAKALMHHYWEKNNQSSSNKSKQNLSKTFGGKRSSTTLPQITDCKQAVFVKSKEQELGHPSKPEITEEQFHTKIEIVDYCCRNETKSYAKFQRRYFKRWAEIQSILKALEKFASHYSIGRITVDTLRIFELIHRVQHGQKINPHHLLQCCEESERLSEEHSNKPGIRFYGRSGYARAIIMLQSHFRRWLQVRRYRRMKMEDRSARKIQAHLKCSNSYRKTKRLIYERQLKKIADFKALQEDFARNYRKNQLTAREQYEIHIPSHNYPEWQKISSENYLEQQNSEICRIFKVAQKNHLQTTHVIYITPLGLSKEIISYYKKLLELSSEENFHHRLTFISPDPDETFPMNLALTQQLYYSPNALKKIKKIVGSNYAFIVPSHPSNDYIHLCTQLKLPLYSSFPQQLQFFQTKSGCKLIQQQLSVVDSQKEGFGVLPYSIDIYNDSSLLNELTNMVYRYPDVNRWVFKIDSETSSRGVAILDTSKLLGNRIYRRLAEQASKPQTQMQQKQCRQQIYSLLENSLVISRQERIIPLDRAVYPTQEEYLKHFYTRGGIIQASINNFESDLENTCFTVNIEPDGQWELLTSFYKITNKNKAVACYFDSSLSNPLPWVEQIINVLKRKNIFGYFTFEFLTIAEEPSRCYYLNSIECHLNQFSSAYLLRDFISKDSNALFVPFLQHPCLKELRLQTFFHLCRLQNISFDIESKTGNLFMFLNGLESGCIGIMTFNAHSKVDCYSHVGEVLQFLNSKMKQVATKSPPSSFLALKDEVKGFLNRARRKKGRGLRSGK